MTEPSVTKPPKVKISGRARAQIRRAQAMNSSVTYGIGGLKRKRKAPPITLRLPKDQR